MSSRSKGGCIISSELESSKNCLSQLVEEYTTRKQQTLVQMKKGMLSREEFLEDAGQHIKEFYHRTQEQDEELLKNFEQYIFGYSRLSELINDEEISDIRVVSFDNIRVKRKGRRQAAGVAFASAK